MTDPEDSGSDALPPKIRIHPPRWSVSTALPWRKNQEYAMSSTFNCDASRNLMITVTVQLTSTRLVVHWYGSLL